MDKKNIYEKKYKLNGLNPSPHFKKQFQYIQKNYIKQKNLRILDLGGGTGEYSLLLQDLDYDVTLFDFSEEAIERGRSIGVVSTICDDFLSYDFYDDKYDIVFVKGFSLLNTDNETDFLSLKKQMNNILKDQGYIIYMGQTDLSGKWTDSGWFQLNKKMIEKYFDTYLILPAFRYQVYLPVFINSFITKLLIFIGVLPKSFTLVGISKCIK